jgi:hypothetical protein
MHALKMFELRLVVISVSDYCFFLAHAALAKAATSGINQNRPEVIDIRERRPGND